MQDTNQNNLLRGNEMIRGALLEKGYSGIADWARRHGHEERGVYYAIKRWGWRLDRTPHGGISRQIIADLRADLGADVVPEVTGRKQA